MVTPIIGAHLGLYPLQGLIQGNTHYGDPFRVIPIIGTHFRVTSIIGMHLRVIPIIGTILGLHPL